MNYCYIKYNEAKNLLQEGDVLLFRRPNSFWSSLIRASGDSLYSHCALVSFTYGNSCNITNNEENDSIIEAIEIKEGVGGRTISLERYINTYDGQIDCFRPNSEHVRTYFDCSNRKLCQTVIKFNGRSVTNEMRRLTGVSYGWSRIWSMAMRSFVAWRYLFNSRDTFDDSVRSLYHFICSNAIAYCFSKNFVDLVHERSDEYVSPANLANSILLDYIFTLEK